jgi:hypothetical protein
MSAISRNRSAWALPGCFGEKPDGLRGRKAPPRGLLALDGDDGDG